LRNVGVDFDLPNREEIEGALKYLNSIAAELLKNSGPDLVVALHAVIQQTCTSETLPRSWTDGVLCPVYKKGDKLDCKNYRGICLFNVTYKVVAKIHANAAVHQYQAGFQSGKSTTDQLLTKATLLIVTCCVKKQNDCSESFET
jgi:hypothetical protein